MSEHAGYAAEEEQPCQCQAYLRATERAALVSARWLGRDDEDAAEEAAATGMRATLDVLPISGRVVFGSLDDSGGLTPGAIVGAGGKEVDLALDPLEGRGVVARGGNGAMSMIAVGAPGRFTQLPDIYMRKMAVGPRARGSIDLLRPVGDNIEAIAEAFGRRVNDVTMIVLDRPRHHDLIEEIRASGARIKLIQDETRVFTTEELAPGEVIVAATGVSNGDLLRGVRFLADSARTHSLMMCTRCNWVRFVDGIHFFARERREEVRLLI